jgi:glycine reductase
MSSYAANLALMLRAEGAILTYLGSGHSLVEVMMTCQKLEQQGVRTTILLPEMAADGDNSGLVYSVPEADAMVSTGNYEEAVTFPAVERVLGGDVLFETGEQAARRFTLPLRAVLSSTDPLGSGVTQGVPR